MWRRTYSHGRAKRWGPIHDTILMYSKSGHYRWNRTYEAYTSEYIETAFSMSDDKGRIQSVSLTGPGLRRGDSGKPWRGIDPGDSGRHWELPPDRMLHEGFQHPEGYAQMSIQDRLDVLDDAGLIYWPINGKIPRHKQYLSVSPGVALQDIILDIPKVSGKEDMGYDTQKPRALLERIISASTDPGDLVFDPFCGCATTMEAANELGREWVGIDIAIHAIKRVGRVRLTKRLGLEEDKDFVIEGVPRNVEGAQDLWGRDKYHFQKWTVEEVDGFVTTRQGADGGVDGRLYFAVPDEPDLQSMVVQVKGGKNVTIRDVRDLRGVLEIDDALMAGLIVMKPLGVRQQRNFDKLMSDAGTLDILGIEYPRMQMLSVEDIFDGRRFRTPTVAGRHAPQPVLPGIPAKLS